MNDNFFENENISDTAATQNPNTNAEPETVVSEPYRYKYENGEKREEASTYSSNYRSGYDTYNYSTSYNYGTSSHITEEVPKKKEKRPLLKAVKWVAGAACFGLIAGAAFIGTSYLATEVFDLPFLTIQSQGKDAMNGNAISGTPVNITLGAASTIEGVESPAESVIVQVVDQNLAATVAVTSTVLEKTSTFWGTYEQEVPYCGSGFIVGKNDTELLIATNNHVVANANKIEVTFIDDTVLEAMVKGTDANADLAIIAVSLDTLTPETLSAIRIVALGDSEHIRLGEQVIAIGNALGYGQSVTVGYISAIDRPVTIDGTEMILLQTDAAINGGNSGGPLFNTKGEVIGINTAKYADTSVEGMCFAIPISRAIPILNELMSREILTAEEKGFLGVSTRSVTSDVSAFYGWPIGAYIVSVVEGSPAQLANLYVGDIVTAVNSVRISTSEDLVSAIASYRYDTTVDLTVQRIINGNYEEIVLQVTLAKRADFEEANEEQKIEEEKENPKKPR